MECKKIFSTSITLQPSYAHLLKPLPSFKGESLKIRRLVKIQQTRGSFDFVQNYFYFGKKGALLNSSIFILPGTARKKPTKHQSQISGRM